ncbi:putative glycerophosphocholine phosphodiesterase GPCPD1 homolog 2 [Hydractinia symbiolongicarpus]|uniref:putative glycerophosphocholine phosphodiesterase GPCPD1 homolog 2 n=1 Tax=Hydractinia symbiolongicarpus TaxID=13093 RepID=UPI00254B9941|nr:putative glycerophosphocholine phosphodiesterase GPCPD1 homolog 2 [Hydractinia symbiolongicarpus]
MIIHLNFHSSEGNPVTLYNNAYRAEDISIKVSNVGCHVIKRYSKDAYSVTDQPTEGIFFHDEEFVTYEFTANDLRSVFPELEMFFHGKCIGHAFITPNQFVESSGLLRTVVTNHESNKLVADLIVHYVVITPWQNEPLSTGPKQFETDDTFLYIGHRGCGKTLTRDNPVLENTVKSFEAAHKNGAAFVEFDIQMTEDRIPVVFHDFHASIFSEQHSGSSDAGQIDVKNLTVSELQKLKMDFARHGAGSCYSGQYADLFPTLADVLKELPLSLGFMIEVKYPYQDLQTGKWELDHYFDRNVIVDAVLNVVMTEERPIMFCSFDADICLMLAYKQTKYPVVFITSGENDSYQYMDIRNRTRMIAVNFAMAHNFMGISIYSNPLVGKDEEFRHVVNTMKKVNKRLYTWGSENSHPDFVDFQRSIKVSGVISDDLGDLNIQKDVKNS